MQNWDASQNLSTLDRLAVGARALITGIDWDRMPAVEARRLQELGLYEGVEVEALHRGSLFFRDPLAVRIGRMRIILRASHAAAVRLGPLATAGDARLAEPA